MVLFVETLPFLENIDKRSCYDGSRELILAFLNPHRKGRPPYGDGSYLAVPCRGALLGHVEWKGEKKVRINVQYAPEYIECNFQANLRDFMKPCQTTIDVIFSFLPLVVFSVGQRLRVVGDQINHKLR